MTTEGINAYVWVAFAIFGDPNACDKFMEKHKLYEGLNWQCVIHDWTHEYKLAPDVSLRPKARPSQ